jgi:hypothetical protein
MDPADLEIARLMVFSRLHSPKALSEAMRIPPAQIRARQKRLERAFGARSPRHLLIRLVAKTETLDVGPGWSPGPGKALGPGQADLLQRRFQGQGDSQIMRELGITRSTLTNRKHSLSVKLGSQSLTGGVLLVLDKLGLSVPGGSDIDPRHFCRVACLAAQKNRARRAGRPGPPEPGLPRPGGGTRAGRRGSPLSFAPGQDRRPGGLLRPKREGGA